MKKLITIVVLLLSLTAHAQITVIKKGLKAPTSTSTDTSARELRYKLDAINPRYSGIWGVRLGKDSLQLTLTPAGVRLIQRDSNTVIRTSIAGKVPKTLTLAGLDLSTNRTASEIKAALSLDNLTNVVPEAVANKSTSTSLGSSNTLYPTQKAVKDYVDAATATKANSASAVLSGPVTFTTSPASSTSTNPSILVRGPTGIIEQMAASALPVSASNVSGTLAIAQIPYSSTVTLGASNTVVPTQGAVKAYVDAAIAAIPAATNASSLTTGTVARARLPVDVSGVSSATGIVGSDDTRLIRYESTKDLNGILLESIPMDVVLSTTSGISNTMYAIRRTARYTGSVTKVFFSVTTQAASLTAGSTNNGIGIYDASGNKLAFANCNNSNYTSTGEKSVALDATVNLVAGTSYYLVFIARGGTTPTFAARASSNTAIYNFNFGSAPFVWSNKSATNADATLDFSTFSTAAGSAIPYAGFGN